MIPIIGVVADVANGIWYAAEGNVLEAIGCGLSAAPVIGEVFGAPKLTMAYLKFAGNAFRFGRSVWSAAKSIDSIITRYQASGFDTKMIIEGIGAAIDIFTATESFHRMGGDIGEIYSAVDAKKRLLKPRKGWLLEHRFPVAVLLLDQTFM